MKLSTILLCGALLSSTAVLADDYETLQMEKVQNPMLWADVPDPDVIRVGDTYDASDAWCADHEVEGPEELGDHRLYLR